MKHIHPCLLPLRQLLFLSAIALSTHARGSTPTLWVEGEQQLDPSSSNFESKVTASGSAALRGAALGSRGQSVSYELEVPASHSDAVLIIRYARLHWTDTLKPAEFNLEVSNGTRSKTHKLLFDNTDGWGTEARYWGLLRVQLGPLDQGHLTLTFTSDSDRSNTVIDGFWLAESEFKVTREELAILNRVEISSKGYWGINLSYSDIEQAAFAGFSITARSFEPSDAKVTVSLNDGSGQVVSTYCEDTTLHMGDTPAELSVPGSWVRDLPDGSYTLSVSLDDGTGTSVLSQPFIAIGSLLDECGRERAAIAEALERHANYHDAAADLQYASDYLENAMVLLRSRGKAPVEESAYRRGIAYFEKSTFRTTEMFVKDLRAFISQTRETVARLDKGLPPYEGRHGDLRRAFYSKATGMLEPYRIYIPSTYGKSGPLPVLMTLHGGGGDENSFPDMDGGIVTQIMERRGYLMISPKATSWYNSPEGQADLKQLMDRVLRDYPETDSGRLYCTGVSRGGSGSFLFAASHPGLLAGIACVSGIGSRSYENNPVLELHLDEFKRVPVLVLIGGEDPVISPEHTEKALNVLKEQGGLYEVRTFPDYGHDYHSEEYMTLTLDFFEKLLK